LPEVYALHNLKEVGVYADESLTTCSVHSRTQSELDMLLYWVSPAQFRGGGILLELRGFAHYAVLLR